MKESKKGEIYKKFAKLQFEDKILMGKVIANAMQPLVLLKQNGNLENIYNYYLEKLYLYDGDEKKLYNKYQFELKEYFKLKDYDEASYTSYEDPNFFEFLAFSAVEVLGISLRAGNVEFGNIQISYIIEISQVLDDYYYNCKDKSDISRLEDLLTSISERIMQSECEKLLMNSIKLCSCSPSKREYLYYELKKLIDEYKYNLKKILNI